MASRIVMRSRQLHLRWSLHRGCVVPRTMITKSSTDWNVSGWRANVVVYCSKWQKKCPPPSLSPGCVVRTQCGDVSHLRLIRWVNIGAEPHRQHMEETNKLFINPRTSDKVALPDTFIYFNKQITNPPLLIARKRAALSYSQIQKSRQLPEGRVTELHTQDCAAGTAPKKEGKQYLTPLTSTTGRTPSSLRSEVSAKPSALLPVVYILRQASVTYPRSSKSEVLPALVSALRWTDRTTSCWKAFTEPLPTHHLSSLTPPFEDSLVSQILIIIPELMSRRDKRCLRTQTVTNPLVQMAWERRTATTRIRPCPAFRLCRSRLLTNLDGFRF